MLQKKMNNDGWIKLYRQILESKIWEKKPSSWVICWLYILLKVSFEDNTIYKKGEAHFRSPEYENLTFDITNDIWYRCVNWLEQEGMIKRQKVWRGEIITVVNYEKYQLDPNHTQIIRQQLKPNINDEKKEQKNDTRKSYPNDTQIIPQTNIDENKPKIPHKNIRNKEVNINISNDILSPNLNESLKEKTEKEAAKANVADMKELIKKFCDVMGYEYNSISIKLNVKPAKELLQTYKISEIIEAVEYGKRKYEKERHEPKTYIPNLNAVLKSIVVWRANIKSEDELIKINKEGGYKI